MRLPIVGMFLLSAMGCGGDGGARVCFGSDEFCRAVFAGNVPPVADAGTDRDVVAGDRVTLDGSQSFDRDGRLVDHVWAQESGPPVPISDATSALASFEVPRGSEQSTLVFRLTVTDDDGASDDDRLSLTVVPGRTAAAQAGLALLETVHTPERVLAAGSSSPYPGFLGIWLGARTLAATAGLERNVDGLLDELRVVEILYTPAALPRSDLYRLGQLEVVRFTEQRDPATAELARRSATHLPSTIPPSWKQAVNTAQLLGPDHTTDEELTRAAERLLSGDDIRLAAPEEIAAATVVLLADR